MWLRYVHTDNKLMLSHESYIFIKRYFPNIQTFRTQLIRSIADTEPRRASTNNYINTTVHPFPDITNTAGQIYHIHMPNCGPTAFSTLPSHQSKAGRFIIADHLPNTYRNK